MLNLDKANKSFNSSSEKSSSSISGVRFGGFLLVEELGRGVGGSAMSGKATGWSFCRLARDGSYNEFE